MIMLATVIHLKLTPLHIARLEAAASAGKQAGHQLIGIEVADAQRDYQWPPTPAPGQHYSRVTLFPGRDYWTLSGRQIRRALYAVLDNYRPDVVVLPGWGFTEARGGLSWCLRHGVPRVVISDNHRASDRSPTFVKRWAKRLLVRQYQAGFAAGTPQVRYLAGLGLPEERCFVGCDVVDNDFFSSENMRWGKSTAKDKRRCSLLSCVRLIPVKNVPTVLDVLASQAKDWSWMIAGDGPLRSEIEAQVKRVGLLDRINLLGHVDYFKLPRLYAQADAYLQPSISDKWGLAVNEAMACGLPVLVSTHCGCCEDLVREGVNGFTFDPMERESLAQALKRLSDSKDRWQEMGKASQEIIARWGLALYAQNFWRACETALGAIPQGTGERVVGKALSFAL